MPNILKHFLRPQVDEYHFPQADEIVIEEEHPPEQTPQEQEPESAVQNLEQPMELPEIGQEQNASDMFDYARVQADAILAQAKRQGEEMLEEYRQQAIQQADQLREQAHQEGFRQGYADGMIKAKADSEAQTRQALQQQADQVKDFLDQAEKAREDMVDQMKGEMCDLSIAIAEKVIHVSLKSSREIILRMVQMATERLRRREWVRIYIGGCDSRELAQISPELTASLAGLSDHIKLIPMKNDESGTCIIEMPDQIIDASVSTQLDNLKDILRGG